MARSVRRCGSDKGSLASASRPASVIFQGMSMLPRLFFRCRPSGPGPGPPLLRLRHTVHLPIGWVAHLVLEQRPLDRTHEVVPLGLDDLERRDLHVGLRPRLVVLAL